MILLLYSVMLVQIFIAYKSLFWCSKRDVLSNFKLSLGGCGCSRLGDCGRIRFDSCGRLQKEEFARSLASVGSLDKEDRIWDLKREPILLVILRYIEGSMLVLLGYLSKLYNGT